MENFNSEGDDYKKKCDDNPEDFNANYDLGNYYYDQGEQKLSEVDNLSDQDDDDYGKSLLSMGNQMIQDSMPYFEKANLLRPEKIDVVEKLNAVYSRLNLGHKVKGINERIDD